MPSLQASLGRDYDLQIYNFFPKPPKKTLLSKLIASLSKNTYFSRRLF